MAEGAESSMSAGAKVWIKDSGSGKWIKATVKSTLGDDLQLLDENGQERSCHHAECFLQNTEVLHVEDMTALAHLHEPGVLCNLSNRYDTRLIYTSVGSILIAVNPFANVPELFGPGVMESYVQAAAPAGNGTSDMAPHVYAVACQAFRQMMRDRAGQAILITGESGAGKTETSKLIMKCLAQQGARLQGSGGDASEDGEAEGGIERRVLESNPLLEAFGNAKTVRNNNSSRFGKYVEIKFDGATGTLLGAAIRTYLLERSRVVHLNDPERSYHIFYQLCAGASKEEAARWHLGPASSFSVLAQSSCIQLQGLDDAQEFKHTRDAMRCVGITAEEQEQIFQVVAGILHLGNISFVEPEGQHDCSMVEPGPAYTHMQLAAELLGVPEAGLHEVLTTRQLHTTEGSITSHLKVHAAEESRNALSKVLYAALFDWLVARVNESLQGPGSSGAAATHIQVAANGAAAAAGRPPAGKASFKRRKSDGTTSPDGPLSLSSGGHSDRLAQNGNMGLQQGSASHAEPAQQRPRAPAASTANELKIGLLDIYGFESFEFNDLEQLCINLANEKLQQHFNQHVFKWEQAEYVREGIDWRHIEYVDNQEVLELIEGKMGLLSMLDEQCKLPRSTAEDLALKFASTPAIRDSARFSRPKRVATAFDVEHYAGPVSYRTNNLMEKNKEHVTIEQREILASSGLELLQTIFDDKPKTTSKLPNSNTMKKRSMDSAGLQAGDAGGATINNRNSNPLHLGLLRQSSSRRHSESGGPFHKAKPAAAARRPAAKAASVAIQFKQQLGDLMGQINVMAPHYVRCIKPNAASQPGVFDGLYALQQLKCGGVMEAVRISCAGFAYKRPHEAFLDYFWPLHPDAVHALRRQQRQNAAGPLTPQDVAMSLLSAAAPEGGFQLGLTKVFLRGKLAALLDKRRTIVLNGAAVRLQAAYRRHRDEARYLALRRAAVVMQTAVRAAHARKLAELLRCEQAALLVQAAWRSRQVRLNLAEAREAAATLQAAWRALCARRVFVAELRERMVVRLQAAWRGRTARLTFAAELQVHRAAAVMQAAWRARAVRQQFARELQLHHAASVMQRAFRAGRRGERVREAFRRVVLQAMGAEKASLVFQTVWRAKAARKEIARMQQAAQRDRFKARIQMFQAQEKQAQQQQQQQQHQPRTSASKAAPAGWSQRGTGSSSMGSGPALQRSATTRPSSAGGGYTGYGGRTPLATANSLGSVSFRGDSTPLTAGGGWRSSTPGSSSDAAFTTPTCEGVKGGKVSERLEVLSDFKLTPLLQFWQARATPVQDARTPGNSSSMHATPQPGSAGYRRTTDGVWAAAATPGENSPMDLDTPVPGSADASQRPSRSGAKVGSLLASFNARHTADH